MLNDIYLPATDMSPEINFQFSENRFSLTGESYPENATAYYSPLITAVEAHLNEFAPSEVDVAIQLAYFNSASTKMLFNLFGVFNTHATRGNTVIFNWIYDEEDETILEFGNDLSSDFTALLYQPKALLS
jgi:hypothetical protein